MAKPKGSESAKTSRIRSKTRSTIEKAKQDKSCEISASVKKQFKVLIKPSVIHKATKDTTSEIDKGEVSHPKKRGRRQQRVDDAKDSLPKSSKSGNPIKSTKPNRIQEQQSEEQPIKKFFSAKEKNYKIPDSPGKSNDIYDFLSLTNKGELRKSDPILKKIIANKNVDLKVYKNGKIVSKKVRKKAKAPSKPTRDPVPADPPPLPVEDVVFDATTLNFSFNNVVNSTPAPDKAARSLVVASPVARSSAMNDVVVNVKNSAHIVESTFKTPLIKNDLRRNAILNSNRQHTAVERRQLLEQARQIIPRMSSTPLVRKSTISSTPKALSPIAPLINSTMRVEDEENYDLPHLNYFGRSSDLTPSYSSDTIPQTPQKPSSKSIINDSNEENIPPAEQPQRGSINHLEKPKQRVPFKEIVVLQNETLPNWRNKAPSVIQPLDYDNLDEVITKRNSEMVSVLIF